MKLILQAIKALFRKIEASRTHWEEVVKVNVVAETTVTIPGDGDYESLPDTTQLTVGKTYFVILNGVSYECVAWYSDDEDAVIIGNGAICGGEGGNGEPFSCDSHSNGHIYLNTEKAGTYTISVSTEENVVHKLDKKYLPDEVIDSIGIANNAQTTANNALITASNAQTTANNAQTTASNAQTTANNAQTTANSKMNASNPVGTGSFSMGRKAGTVVGDNSHAEGLETTASGPDSHAEGYRTTASGSYSHAEGSGTTASGNRSHAEGSSTNARADGSHAEGSGTDAKATCSHAEGYNTTASGGQSHAEGNHTTALGNHSHAEGSDTTAKATCSHAEGYNTTAEADYSHAEGYNTTASGGRSHAEGHNTTASGNFSHAEGLFATAEAECSHAEGCYTIAGSSNQHVQGKYNVKDSQSKYAHIVGNGVSLTDRSNAHTLDWNGVAWFQGRPQFGGTAQDQDSQTVMANGDKEIILTSSTANSTKKFKITVDDSGTLTATEVV